MSSLNVLAKWEGATSGRGEGIQVAFVPQDESLLRDAHQFIRSAIGDGHGKFSIESLRPSSDYAFAFDRIEREMLEGVAFVRELISRATRIDVRHGEATSISRSQPWPDY